MNSDPSSKTTCNNGQMNWYAGFPLCNTSDTNNGYQDQENYTIRTWLGLSGPNASTTIIDTSLYGDLTMEITLAPLNVLMLSPAVGTSTSYSSAFNNEVI